MKLASSVCKVYPNGFPQHRDDMDAEAKHDAQRCVDALKKRYSEWDFNVKQVKVGHWDVEGVIGVAHPIYVEMKGFAEGFLASAFLWER